MTSAIEDYTKAIELLPDDIYAYSNLSLWESRYCLRGKMTILTLPSRILTRQYNSNETMPSPIIIEVRSTNRGTDLLSKKVIMIRPLKTNKAIQLKPGYADAYINRGNTYLKKGETIMTVPSQTIHKR